LTKIVNECNEEVKKGVCVQNQLKIWEKLLEIRIKAQKMLITANKSPDSLDSIDLLNLDDGKYAKKIDDTCDTIFHMLDNLLELQSNLVEK
jgi:protein AATF/BFR2